MDRLNWGETSEDAARREVLAEAGIRVSDLRLVDFFAGEQLHDEYPHGDEVFHVDVVCCTNRYQGRIRISHASGEHAFLSLRNIPDDVSPPQRVIVEYLKEHFRST